MRASTLWWIDRTLLALHAAGATLAWFSLPPRVPIHFGISGNPDAWAGTSFFSWFGLLTISTALSGFISVLTNSGPLELWNIPEKERFLRLTPEQQAPVLELLRAFGAATAICATVVLLALQAGIYLTAVGAATGLPWYIQVVMNGTVASLLLALIPWARAVRRAILRASASG